MSAAGVWLGPTLPRRCSCVRDEEFLGGPLQSGAVGIRDRWDRFEDGQYQVSERTASNKYLSGPSFLSPRVQTASPEGRTLVQVAVVR